MDTKNSTAQIMVGPSLNLEFYQNPTHKTNGYDKVELSGYEVGIGGSSFLIANALRNLGYSPELIAFMGPGDDSDLLFDVLNKKITKTGIGLKPISCLKETSTSFIERQTSGREIIREFKSEIIQEKFLESHNEITNFCEPYDWKIASGIGTRNAELIFVQEIFRENSINVLIPKMTLIESEQFKSILPLVDIICINQHEFEASKMELKEFHDLGIKLTVVTDSDKGGRFCFLGNEGSYDAHIPVTSEVYPTGAGDWFTASLISYLIKEDVKNLKDTRLNTIKEALNFAAEIAGKKVCFKGALNGPKI